MTEGKIQAQVRKSLRLKQLEVAAESGINRSRLSLIENGWIDPTPQELAQIQSAIQRLVQRYYRKCAGV